MKDKTVIIGAGPAGMAAALELFNAHKNSVLIEKEDKVGGLAKTLNFGDFKTDIGPHRFFSKNQELYVLIKKILGKNWKKVDRSTKFFIKGDYYDYPLKLKNTFSKIGLINSIIFLKDYIHASIILKKKESNNFEEYVLKNFGKSLAEFNILNYTEKVWGLKCSMISKDWATQRIKDLSVKSLIKNLVMKKKGPKTLVDQFFYPENGTGEIYENILREISKDNKIFLKTYPIRIKHNKKTIEKVILSNKKSINLPKNVISSIPINIFLDLLDPKPPKAILDAVKKLRFRSQVYLFIIVNKPKISKNQWIYFPELDIPFSRISEMKNFSRSMSPQDKTSLFIEYFCWEKDKIWNMSKKEIFELTITHLERIGLLKKGEVLAVYHFRKKNVYPVYEVGYEKKLGIVKEYLDSFKNLLYIGRLGRFKYTNQDHSLEMGLEAARSIINNKKVNFDRIGSKKEYLEKGFIKRSS